MSNTVFTMTATKAQSANTVHAMDAESAGAFEQLVGTILPPASKVTIEPKTESIELDVVYVTATGTQWKVSKATNSPVPSVLMLVNGEWALWFDVSISLLQHWLDTGVLTKIKPLSVHCKTTDYIIDVATTDKAELMEYVKSNVGIHSVSDGGEYREDNNWSRVHITALDAVWTLSELDDMLYLASGLAVAGIIISD